MCGIAGYSVSPESGIDRTLAAQALLAAIAERGADAVGYAYRGAEGRVNVHKQRSGASALLEQLDVPADATQVLVHVRDYTKGHPTIAANNHPVRHGAVVGIHNGVIANDEEVFARHGFERAEPGMTVDSEAIFALVDEHGPRARVLDELYGSMACAWLDERRPRVLYVARGIGRPLWIGRGRHEIVFASTRHALEIFERYARVSLRKSELDEGALLGVEGARIALHERFRPDRGFYEAPLPPVRAPHEAVSCLRRLAILAAA